MKHFAKDNSNADTDKDSNARIDYSEYKHTEWVTSHFELGVAELLTASSLSLALLSLSPCNCSRVPDPLTCRDVTHAKVEVQ